MQVTLRITLVDDLLPPTYAATLRKYLNDIGTGLVSRDRENGVVDAHVTVTPDDETEPQTRSR